MLKVLALGHVLVGKAAVALGLRPRPDGWRRIVGVGLRDEASKFAVSAFGLTPPRVEGVAAALARFLRTEPDARFTLRHDRWLISRRASEFVDLVVMRFAPDGTLTELEPHLDPLRAVPGPADQERATAAVVTAYNRTRTLPEATRPTELEHAVRRELIDHPTAERHAVRLLAAACASVEAVDPAERFTPPEFRTRRGLGFGHLTFVLRPVGETVDVWALAHHTGADGAPLQEMMSRLERSWGCGGVLFPDPDEPATHPRACHLPGEREVYESTSFHDFTELLARRKRLSDAHGVNIPFGCLLLWLLSREPEFAGVKFGSTVDVPANGTAERDVDLVALRPTDFADLPAYARAFAAGITAARTRTSATRADVSTAELLPPWLHRRMLETNARRVADTFGSVGLSVLKDAKVFIAPFADVGFPGGFIAVGGVGLPTASGRAVGAVHVKGTREQTAAYPQVFRRALAGVAEWPRSHDRGYALSSPSGT
jgi:hypothetical protein